MVTAGQAPVRADAPAPSARLQPPRLAADLAPGFADEIFLDGLPPSTALAWAPDGRLFLATKAGQVRIVQNGVLLAEPFIDLSDQVNNFTDRGLNGMTLHPDFANHPYVYLFYVYDPPDLPKTNNINGLDGSGARASRLVRVTADPQNPNRSLPDSLVVLLGTGSTLENMGAWDTNSEQTSPYPAPGCLSGGQPIQDCLPVDSPAHTVGMVRFGPDGALYVGHGDAATLIGADPRALRAQNLDLLVGKVLRIDPETGYGYPNNPFYDGDVTSNRSRVYAYGLRNPFRFAFRPDTGELVIGDVGWNTWEEVNVGRGLNFGWPCYEGADVVPEYQADPQTAAACQALYAQGPEAVAAPVYTYAHVPVWSGSIILGDFYTGAAYPAEYHNALFMADYAVNWIKTLRFGLGDAVTVSDFAQRVLGDWNGPVQVALGPDGNLYYLTIGLDTSSLHRLRYVGGGNRLPIASLSASPTNGGVPLAVTFSAAGSIDPDTETLSYAWDLGDGAVSTEPEFIHTYTVAGVYTATLTATDPQGGSDAKQVVISVGNHAPVAAITEPPLGKRFAVGDEVVFAGVGTDVEDQTLSGAQLQWSMRIHHQEHVHLNALPPTSGAEGSFHWPDHGDNTWLELCLTVHDSGGLADSDCRALYPQETHWVLRTQPLGFNVSVNGVTHKTPYAFTLQPGVARTVSAPETYVTWTFTEWSNGGDRTQVITATADSLQLTAIYVNAVPPVLWLPSLFR